MKRLKKTFSFLNPLSGSIIAINKPRITATNAAQIESAFEICISSTPSTPSSEIIEHEYKKNIDDQHSNKCLEKIPLVKKFLEEVIDTDYDKFFDAICNKKVDEDYSRIERQYMQLLRYILVDYHANCEKPNYYTESNERTPYCEHVIPIFKYFSAVFKNISFMWYVDQTNSIIHISSF